MIPDGVHAALGRCLDHRTRAVLVLGEEPRGEELPRTAFMSPSPPLRTGHPMLRTGFMSPMRYPVEAVRTLVTDPATPPRRASRGNTRGVK